MPLSCTMVPTAKSALQRVPLPLQVRGQSIRADTACAAVDADGQCAQRRRGGTERHVAFAEAQAAVRHAVHHHKLRQLAAAAVEGRDL